MALKTTFFSFFVPLLTALASDGNQIGCNSAVKLQHKSTGYYLSSMGINWGSGSGQQAVTTQHSRASSDSMFLIKDAHPSSENKGECDLGQPIKCGQTIRLEHLNTQKNVHTHAFRSPLTNNQEVSAFGEQGVGDSGDDWVVICATKSGTWERGENVEFRSVDTGRYLASSNNAKFTQANCPNCPILGHYEVMALGKSGGKNGVTTFKADIGVFVQPN